MRGFLSLEGVKAVFLVVLGGGVVSCVLGVCPIAWCAFGLDLFFVREAWSVDPTVSFFSFFSSLALWCLAVCKHYLVLLYYCCTAQQVVARVEEFVLLG